MLTQIVIISLLILIPTTVLAQQPSMMWDEKTKTWISTPAAATATAPPPVQQPATPTAAPPTVVQQSIPVTTGSTTVDLGTLVTVITPIIAGIAGVFVKNRKDMEKKDEEVKAETIKAIEEAIIPKLKQIVPIAEQSAKQDVKISQLAEELYKIMADKANDIHDKPEIQQLRLVEDAAKSKIVAEQAKDSSFTVWDEKTKSWISK